MRDLTKAAFSLAWAMPLYGVQQFVRVFSPSSQDRDRATGAFDAVTGVAAEALGDEEGWLRRFYQLGQCFQNAALTMGPNLLTPDLLDPRVWADVSGEVAQRSAEGARLLAEGKGDLMWREIRDKGEVFCLVLDVAKLIGVPADPPFPLYELLDRAYALGPFRALWAVEGLGHDYGDSFWEQGVVPHRILDDERTSDLPAKSLTMLHAGIGLSFAQTCLEGAGTSTPDAELRRIVANILQLCRDNSRPGDVGAAYESLGLVTRTFHPDLVGAVDRAVRDVAPGLLGYYWHGVGRAIFFAAINFVPGSDRFVFTMARQEAPDEAARLSAVAGAAWAYSLVAQRDPRILAGLVIGPFGEELARDNGFSNGVASSTMMRFDTTPEAPFLAAFYEYRPSDPRVADLWERLVRVPAETALNVYYPVLKQTDRLGEIFRYQDLPALVAQAQGGPAR